MPLVPILAGKTSQPLCPARLLWSSAGASILGGRWEMTHAASLKFHAQEEKSPEIRYYVMQRLVGHDQRA